MSPSKIALLNHGFRLEQFERVDPMRVDAMKAKYGIAPGDFVVGAPALRAGLVENGRRSVRERFTLDRQMRELASLYERWSA